MERITATLRHRVGILEAQQSQAATSAESEATATLDSALHVAREELRKADESLKIGRRATTESGWDSLAEITSDNEVSEPGEWDLANTYTRIMLHVPGTDFIDVNSAVKKYAARNLGYNTQGSAETRGASFPISQDDPGASIYLWSLPATVWLPEVDCEVSAAKVTAATTHFAYYTITGGQSQRINVRSADYKACELVPVEVTTTPSGSVQIAIGAGLQIGVLARLRNGTYYSECPFTFTTQFNAADASPELPAISLSSLGYIQGLRKGSAGVVVACRGVQAGLSVRVENVRRVGAITVGGGGSVSVGQSLALSATASDDRGNPANDLCSTFAWSSSNSSVATVDAGGSVTGVAPGSASITATCQDVTGSASLTVECASQPSDAAAVSADPCSPAGPGPGDGGGGGNPGGGDGSGGGGYWREICYTKWSEVKYQGPDGTWYYEYEPYEECHKEWVATQRRSTQTFLPRTGSTGTLSVEAPTTRASVVASYRVTLVASDKTPGKKSVALVRTASGKDLIIIGPQATTLEVATVAKLALVLRSVAREKEYAYTVRPQPGLVLGTKDSNALAEQLRGLISAKPTAIGGRYGNVPAIDLELTIP